MPKAYRPRDLTHAELNELKAHGLHLLGDDPATAKIFNKMLKQPCVQSLICATGGQLSVMMEAHCGRCKYCIVRKLKETDRAKR